MAGSNTLESRTFPAFEAALKLLGPDVDPSRVLHCGDSLMHDIAGANAAGIHSLFVAGGIHAEALGIPDAGAPPASARAAAVRCRIDARGAVAIV